MGAIGRGLGNASRWLIRRLARIYYPRIEVSHAERIPRDGPVLLAANHPNSLLDAVLLGIAAQRPVRFLAKAPLFEVPVFGAVLRALGMIPAYRGQDDPKLVEQNAGMLERAATLISSGEALGIFPEGLTHDAPQVAKVRSGAARIAMQALEQGAQKLKVVPIGLNYQEKGRFRSAVWIRVGEPIDAPAWLEKHGGDGRKAMRELTREIERELRTLTVHLDRPEWEALLTDLEVLAPPSEETRQHPASALMFRRRIAGAINYFHASDPPRAATGIAAIQAYRESVAEVGLRVDSPVLRFGGLELCARLLATPILLLLGLLPALAGLLHHFVPYSLVSLLAPRVQTPGRTTVALARLSLGLPIYLAWYAGVIWFWLTQTDFRPWAIYTWTALMPWAGLMALLYLNVGREAFFLWWHQMRLVLHPRRAGKLRGELSQLKMRLNAMAADYVRAFPQEPLPPAPPVWRRRLAAGVGWGLAATAGCAAFFVGREMLREKPLAELSGRAPNLGRIDPEHLAARLVRDEAGLADLLNGLDELEARALKLRSEFESGERTYYKQADNDAVRQELMAYLGYRKALLHLLWKYREAGEVRREDLRLRAGLLSCTAAAVLYEASAKFVTGFQCDETIKKLNEAAPQWDIPAGTYDTIKANLAQLDNLKHLHEALAYHRSQAEGFARTGLHKTEPQALFHARIARATETIERLGGEVWKTKVSLAATDVTGLGKSIAYGAQSMIATWIGDTKIRAPREGQALLTAEDLERLRGLLQPGDILIERRNWYLSNMFLPGYWPHAALYVGAADELHELGLHTDPRIAPHWDAFAAADEHGHAHVVVEALSEGVVCTSLEHSAGGGDSVAVLRPRLSLEQKKEAIARGFSYVGRPYDFEFDFFSTDKIVCTELVFRAYDGVVDFPLVDVMGRKTLPAIEIVRKYVSECGTEGQQLDLIAFVDGDEIKQCTVFADEQAFMGTLTRPAMTWLNMLSRPSAPDGPPSK
ncbi:MAG: hypothetical protein AMXMBFR7_08080 [Planctomycetota bacterium]